MEGQVTFLIIPIIFGILDFCLGAFLDVYDFYDNEFPKSIFTAIFDMILIYSSISFCYNLCLSLGINMYDYKIFLVIFIGILGGLLYLLFTEEIDLIIPCFNTFIANIIIVFLVFLSAFMISSNIQTKKFDSMEYSLTNTEVIYLKSMDGLVNTTGSISGGRYYINGVFNTNYEIYYTEIEEDGNIVIDKISYDKEHCKIYENDKETPRIEVYTYSKILMDKNEEKILLSDEYIDYIIYIPVGTYNNTYEGNL